MGIADRWRRLVSRASGRRWLVGTREQALVTAREAMVRDQIEKRGVHDPRVLAAMRRVERHLFVPPGWEPEAYADRAIGMGDGQTISQPYIVAVMTELLELAGEERVLEVGTGSGYQAAVLSQLAKTVHTIELRSRHLERVRTLLSEQGCANVTCHAGDGSSGLAEFAPFDAILVSAAPSFVPSKLNDQLAEGGRLVIPVGETRQELRVYQKREGQIVERRLFAVQFVPLIRGPAREG